LNLDWLNTGNLFWFYNWGKVTVKLSSDETIKLIKKVEFVSQKDNIEILQNSLSKIIVEKEENTFLLSYENNSYYKNNVPPHFVDQEYVLYVPKSWNFMIEKSYNFYLENVENINNNEYHYNNCENTFFWYDETKKWFVCKQ
jgi:hypothetical protein